MEKSASPIFGNLKWVMIECPYAQWENEAVQAWFSKFVHTKRDGYKKEYPSKVVPFGTYDFISDLFLIVDENDGLPLCVYKAVTQTRCAEFGLEDELCSLLRRTGDVEHLQSLKKIFSGADEMEKKVAYLSSWTIHPSVRANQGLSRVLKEMTFAIYQHYCLSFGISELLIGGSIKFKVPDVQRIMGFQDLKMDECILGPISSPFLLGEKTQLMHLKKFSDDAIKLATRYESYWTHRSEFGSKTKKVA